MNRSSRRMTKKQAEQNARRMMTSAHILIAVVAIIECLILVTFTTFSWIESNSSLVIQNGPESTQVDANTTKKMDIAHQLHSTIDLSYPHEGDDDTDFAPLNDFFSEVKYFEFAKATSSDGRTLFFPCRNNTYTEAGKYRKGDTVDYNTSFLYFDFVIRNTDPGNGDTVMNRDVYFDESTEFSDIFTVTGDGLTAEQKTALCNAMRMSITTQVGSNVHTDIYAKKAYSGSGGYQSINTEEIASDQSFAYDENGVDAGHTNNRDSDVTTKALSASVYHTTSNVVDSEKLFVVKKNAETKVSFRIWFEVWDPDFVEAFDIENIDYSDYEDSTDAYWKIPNATVGIKFRLKTSGNDLRSIYFDDYTLSNVAGKNHLTDENPNYKVWFYTYQPAVDASGENPARAAKYVAIPLERDSSDGTHALWSANTATASEMEYLMGSTDFNDAGANNANNSATRYTKSYFCYGNFSTKQAKYKWELPAAPVSDDYVFNAYSYMPNTAFTYGTYNWTSDDTGTTWQNCRGWSTSRAGIGLWHDNDASSMTLLKFKDMATAVTETNYNGGANFQIMNAAAVADNHSHYFVYANNVNESSASNNFTDTVAKITAAMYYDDSEQVFKSYVPTGWLTGNTGVSFTYTAGTYSNANATLRWFSGASAAQARTDSGEFIYTALGYSNRSDVDTLGGIGYTAGFFSGTGGFMKGVGTWSDVEQVKFSTELIDDSLNSAYRYYVGIPGSGSYSQNYYVMIPDATHTTFSAYIPEGYGAAVAATGSQGVSFTRLDAVKTSNSGTAPTIFWFSGERDTYSTFYPIDCTGTSTPAYTHGFWNISVLVDGTYENLIYDTLTDGEHDENNGNAPVATYAPVITPGTTTILVNDTPTEVNHDVVDYNPRSNYGKLEFTFDDPPQNSGDSPQTWHTVCDDTTDTYTYTDAENGVYAGMIDRYRIYVSAEGVDTVYWRWTPYAGYSITFNVEGVSKTVTAVDTYFEYTHDVTDAASTGIYQVVTEAPASV